VGLFCLFLLFICCYNNRKSHCRDSSTTNVQSANIQEESGASLIQGQSSSSNRRSEAPHISRVIATSSASPAERDSLQEEDQLPPKYEDIENHPIVTEHYQAFQIQTLFLLRNTKILRDYKQSKRTESIYTYSPRYKKPVINLLF